MAARAGPHGPGRCTAGPRGRARPDGLRRRGAAAVAVPWGALTGGHASTGAPLSDHSARPQHRLTADQGVDLAHAGRGRGKSANAHQKVLQTQGDPLAPNLGHGQQSLAACMRRLTLLALLCQTVGEWSEAQDAWLRQGRARRQTGVQALQAFRRARVFEQWDHLMAGMLRGLALESQCATS